MPSLSRPARFGLAVAVGIGAVIGARQLLVASDHQDTADVELNPSQDMTDFYAFPTSSGRIALVLNSYPFISPAAASSASFDKNLLYQIKVDNTGDGVEDRVFQITFDKQGTSQQVTVLGPVAPNETGTANTLVKSGQSVTGALSTNLGSNTGMQVFAGIRDVLIVTTPEDAPARASPARRGCRAATRRRSPPANGRNCRTPAAPQGMRPHSSPCCRSSGGCGRCLRPASGVRGARR